MAITISGSTDTISAADGSLTIAGTQNVDQVTVGTGASVGSPATNVLTLGTNDTERLRIDSSGNIGVGTNSPASSLNFGDTAANSGIQFGDSADFTIKRNISDTTIDFNVGADINHFQWKVGGINYMRLDSSGRLGIGTDLPNYKLHLHSATAGDSNYLQITHSDAGGGSSDGLQLGLATGSSPDAYLAQKENADLIFQTNAANRARIDSSGRLLINGTTSQTWSGGAPVVQVSGTSASGTMHLGAFQYSDSSDGGELVLGSSRGTTVGANTIVQNGDTLGRIRFCGADGVDFTNRGGEITCAVDGTPGSDDLPTRMMFYTASDGAGSPSERMRIQSSGSTQFQNTSQFYPNPDNSCSLGRSGNRWSAVWASNGTIQTSDERLKTEVTNSSLASDFIKALRPVSYKWIEGGKRHTGEYDEDNNWVYESTPGQRTHWGFIAQEVKQAADDAGVDFGGWVLEDKDDPESTQSLRYDQFIAPLTKALQEALAKIETLEQRLSDAGIA